MMICYSELYPVLATDRKCLLPEVINFVEIQDHVLPHSKPSQSDFSAYTHLLFLDYAFNSNVGLNREEAKSTSVRSQSGSNYLIPCPRQLTCRDGDGGSCIGWRSLPNSLAGYEG